MIRLSGVFEVKFEDTWQLPNLHVFRASEGSLTEGGRVTQGASRARPVGVYRKFRAAGVVLFGWE